MPVLLVTSGQDDLARIALYLAVLFLIARLGGFLARRAGQPPVLGELVIGVAAGNLGLIGVGALEPIKEDAYIALLANLGALILLFEVGISSTVREMLRVGAVSAATAMIGAVAPFVLGWLVALWLLPDRSVYTHAFVGAALSATSIGITARVLRDLGAAASKEARIILGAAVLDDVLGLVLLAVVAGAISAADAGERVSLWAVVGIVGGAALFLAVSLALGLFLSAWLFRLASFLRAEGALLVVSLAFCLFMAWAAGAIGLAPIVGAFAAGLILEDAEFEERGKRHTLEEQVRPISAMLAPLFFVFLGMKADFRSLIAPDVQLLAAALTVAAIAGKLGCGLAVRDPEVSRVSVGIGMVPRGEVGLVFAGIGLGLAVAGVPILDQDTFSAIVLMVIATTLLTPPGLRWSLGSRADPG